VSRTYTRQYVKLCDVRDFEHPALLDAIRSLVPERDPTRFIERKVWEFGMLILFMEEVGLLNESTRALSVGAGNERVLYWLANRIGGVVATDTYGAGAFADGEAARSMLEDPASHAPYPYRTDRLDVRWMDGRQLEFPDASFDLVLSVSSIEHFGSPRDIAQAAREIGRVTKPGGFAVVITECFVKLHPLDTLPIGFMRRVITRGRMSPSASPRRRGALSEVLTPRELESRIIEPSGLALAQPVDLSLSKGSWENVITARRDGTLHSAGGKPYPLVLMRHGRSYFTSVCLVLERPLDSTTDSRALTGAERAF
jgi:SAM-dependent methyltransferase